jgi:hypothetical protein
LRIKEYSYRKLGTVIEVSRDTVKNPAEGSSGRVVFSVKTLLGNFQSSGHTVNFERKKK